MLKRWSEETENNKYLLQKQNDDLRDNRVIIRALNHKVDALLKEQNSKGGVLSNLLGSFGGSKTTSNTFANHEFTSNLPRTYTEPPQRYTERPKLPSSPKRHSFRVGRDRAKSDPRDPR